jgi:hypothetical protein
MNYAQARQRDDRIWRSGPCREHDDGHATSEEAERHFWEYEIEHASRFVVPNDQAGQLLRCAICSAFTASTVRLDDGYTTFILCPDHQDRASLEQVHPFESGRTLIYS